ncbi:uncharacterized protein LOC122264248 [Penaeus japonicus]|uniref:uncharacterized protein LOC122259386 n=1 Tax=Penaeus japonicus TaxID=27405 RepID=UPI001C716A97|nr:uncharacterized protein LOC122259386 [Penaeus japonicus]XP_042887496.1 uncharacterized protein LOC122263201 [Penaeus japonicus]XP_042888980.1 uncharacterized protein LOC122264248 [Penaeus japonicus]
MDCANLWKFVLIMCVVAPDSAQETQLQAHLEHFDGVRNPMAATDEPRLEARRYIKDKFRELGLNVHSQTFNTVLKPLYEERTVTGENIVGVAAGTVGGPVVVVGADYDTPLQSSPLEDNGAGVAALLEVARHFMHETARGGSFEQLNTVVFVAFDLNVKTYGNNHPGKPGSYHFLHQWLWPYINQTSNNFAGAIILDSITKFSTQFDSQYVLQEFKDAFPKAASSIANSGNKGDFLAMFTREDSRSIHLANTFTANYEKDRKARMFRLQPMPVRDGLSFVGVLEMFNHQSHYPFWSFRPSEELVPLPALLLTDTDVYRMSMDVCDRPCTPAAFLTRGREGFITKAIDAVTNTLLNLQTKRLPVSATSGGAGGTTTPLLFITCIAVISRIIL